MSQLAELRVIDFGEASALRSQTLWHAVAHGVGGGSPPTLSFVRPMEPYVSIGYHRNISEVDLGYCADNNLPVIRRMVGGGPVYLDPSQLFFQIVLPKSSVTGVRTKALEQLLQPATAAFMAAGVKAKLDDYGEFVSGERKICGHGAGEIDGAVVVVGNLIEEFDHEAATSILSLVEPVAKAEVLRLMKRFVGSGDINLDSENFVDKAVESYSTALSLEPVVGDLTELERDHLTELDVLFSEQSWTNGEEMGLRTPSLIREVKVRAGVHVISASSDALSFVVSLVHGCVERAWIRSGTSGELADFMRDDLEGIDSGEIRRVLLDVIAGDMALAGALKAVRFTELEGARS